jgi:hypothetical protein
LRKSAPLSNATKKGVSIPLANEGLRSRGPRSRIPAADCQPSVECRHALECCFCWFAHESSLASLKAILCAVALKSKKKAACRSVRAVLEWRGGFDIIPSICVLERSSDARAAIVHHRIAARSPL